MDLLQCILPAELGHVFDHLVHGGEVVAELLSLLQGSTLITDHSILFCILAADSVRMTPHWA